MAPSEFQFDGNMEAQPEGLRLQPDLRGSRKSRTIRRVTETEFEEKRSTGFLRTRCTSYGG
jgi:hypothetical protein